MQGSNDTYIVTQDRKQPGLAQRVGSQKQTAPSAANDPIRWAYLASIHQMAPPKRGGTHLVSFATHLSTPEGWKAELAWLADL